MKIGSFVVILFLAIPHAVLPLDVDTRLSTPAPIQSYREVLARVPANLRTMAANDWTRVQRERANSALQEALIDKKTSAKLRLKVTRIADWGGMTFYSEIPNHEGYHIRVFGKFTEEWSRKLTSLKNGDTAFLEGELKSVTYRGLWGQFTLSICLRDCTFTKVPPANEPNISL